MLLLRVPVPHAVEIDLSLFATMTAAARGLLVTEGENQYVSLGAARAFDTEWLDVLG